MSYLGFLKDSGGAKRLRFVMPGYDADDEDVPPNKVIFDSNDLGTLSVLASGTYNFSGSSPSATEHKIASWKLEFVPLCHFVFQIGGVVMPELHMQLYTAGLPFNSGYVENNMFRITDDGIYLRHFAVSPAGTLIHWTAFNLKVV